MFKIQEIELEQLTRFRAAAECERPIMTREEIVNAVNSTFTEMLEVPAEELSPEKEIFKDLGLDSLDMVDLMIGLQRKFGISLRQNEEIRKIVMLGDVYAFFEKLEAKRRESAASSSGGE